MAGTLPQMPDLLDPSADFMVDNIDMMAMDLDPTMGDLSQMYVPGPDAHPSDMIDAFASIPTTATELEVIDPGPPAIGLAAPILAAAPPTTGRATGGSTTTEFTKRRNWSQRVIEELRDFLHILSPEGRVLYVSPSCQAITGYEPGQILGKYIGEFIHQDDAAIFVREFNESIASGRSLRLFYRFLKADGSYAILESHGHPHLTTDAVASAFGPSPTPSCCPGVFMMARPYPTKNAVLLDSFLEHKIENERLKKKVLDLKREERDDAEQQEREWASQPDSTTSTGAAATVGSMAPPPRPGQAENALTQHNLDEAAGRSDTLSDKMARFEASPAASHFETIEMLTGLRYRDGERSQGISTGDASPTLIRGDAGIAIPADSILRDRPGAAGGEKKKKMKLVDEYVCQDCGTLDSPEWRKGPSGPKTLCNACGLRWAKKEKKRRSSGGPGPVPPLGQMPMHASEHMENPFSL